MTVLESILKSIRGAASYNKHDLAPPCVILWPDEDRLWEPCIGHLQQSHSALWSIGEYAPNQATGPAVWLRYQLEEYSGTDIPVIYLPGIGRSAFRSADQCPDQAKHLFALQFQGQFWIQKNGKNWTPFAFFSSRDGGLSLDVAGDQNTKTAIQESLQKLLEIELDALQGRKLEAGDFRAVVTSDPARTLLKWISDPVKLKQELEISGSDWPSFCAVCRDSYGFNPEKDGAITAGEKLTSDEAAWELVWGRYKESPRSYPGVKALLESFEQGMLFEPPSEYRPRTNREEEDRLEKDLLSLESVQSKDAIERIKELAGEHTHRVSWVWADLGESPLALSIGHLKELVDVIEASGNPSTLEALAEYYSTLGWKADRSVLRALDSARSPAANKAVTVAIRAVYLSWLEKFSVLTQGRSGSYPVTGPQSCRSLPAEEGTIYLFADGLRMDLARELEQNLRSSSLAADVTFESYWSALPTVTATAKPAWMPLAGTLGGPLEGAAFQPKESSNGKALTHARFKQLMQHLGIIFLEQGDLPLASGCAWTEYGAVDKYGHDQGAKLARRIEEELTGLQQWITDLLKAGWTKVKVVTDHGWLLVPGGFPKTELPQHLTESRWGRCAVPSAGAQHNFPMTSWFWDSAEAVVLAPGISCFMAGMEYAHGGLTMQEALIPSLTISFTGAGAANLVVLKELKWSGMRLNVFMAGAQGFTLDLRSKVADASTSLTSSPMPAAEDGQKTSLLVTDDDALGSQAFLVAIDQSGQTIYKHSVVIGES